MSDTLTSLLRGIDAALATHGWTVPGATRGLLAQALALADEQERQLAAAQAQVEALRAKMPTEDECSCETCCDMRDILAANPADLLAAHDERVRREALESLIKRREGCHATFNGGHHEQLEHEAFHHGMDTVFNVIQGELAGQPRQDGYALLRERAKGGASTRLHKPDCSEYHQHTPPRCCHRECWCRATGGGE